MGVALSDSWVRGGRPHTSRAFYKVVVQATILFRAETWVVSPRIYKTLDGFRHRVVLRLVLILPSRDTMGGWV